MDNETRALFALVLIGGCFAPVLAVAEPAEERAWQRSAFFGIGAGVAVDAVETSRTAIDEFDRAIEAYSAAAFLFGVHGGFRFNEVIGLEVGWHEQQHDAFREWGGYAGYHLFHLAARLAWPMPTRQSLLLRLGVSGGAFEYGTASFDGVEDNATFAIGPLLGLGLEHELGLGVVSFIDFSYLILRRQGMSGPLLLYYEDGPFGEEQMVVADVKDFTQDATVHAVWATVGIQFEWIIR